MEKYILWLMIMECTNLQKIKLIKKYKDEKKIFFNFDEIKSEIPFSNKKFTNYDKNETLNKACNLLEKLKLLNISFISFNDDRYPESLKNIQEPPYVIFYKGDISLLINYDIVAIVGSRKNTSYGEMSTRVITKDLASNDICIVSGGALGIDKIAHDECLKNNGKTIAVLGCGLDVCYPLSNKSLFNKIEQEGLIISEFLPGTKPNAYNFPRRNRIISGLAKGIIITEANKKSGSLITASCALDQGKDILVVPHTIFSNGGCGCNCLIRDGAYIYTCLDDIYTTFKIDKKAQKITGNYGDILNMIKNEPVHIDDIFIKSQVDRNTLYGLLFELQIKNEILSLPGNYYVRIT
ncbi:DNA-processing protein DprA [Clostridium sp. Ade.TY]|uniref:DNA-processing protein DprA n=1 Tax=Clostridium sp. Ade.TY TaxID=1391647 RepID=UPI0004157FC0|nr:DNA-processing protein DprA [Clostridium sp. Ade.TY]